MFHTPSSASDLTCPPLLTPRLYNYLQMGLNHLSATELPPVLPLNDPRVSRQLGEDGQDDGTSNITARRNLAVTKSLGLKRPKTVLLNSPLRTAGFKAGDCPDSVDWRTFGAVAEVKDQVGGWPTNLVSVSARDSEDEHWHSLVLIAELLKSTNICAEPLTTSPSSLHLSCTHPRCLTRTHARMHILTPLLARSHRLAGRLRLLLDLFRDRRH